MFITYTWAISLWGNPQCALEHRPNAYQYLQGFVNREITSTGYARPTNTIAVKKTDAKPNKE